MVPPHLVHRFKSCALFVFFLISIPVLLLHFTSIIQYAQQPTAYLWQDETATYAPMMNVYKGGYLNYRCLAAPWTVCYGGGEVLIDTAIAKVAPQNWLKQGPIYQPPGVAWPWLVEYPSLRKLMVWVRFVEALALCGVLAFLFRSYGVGIAAAVSVSFATSYPFLDAWSGIKNDYAATFWLLIFWITFLRAVSVSNKKLLWRVGCLALGILSFSVRASALPPFAIATLFLLYKEFRERRSWSSLFARIILTTTLCLLTYLAINPSFWVSGGEFRWLSTLFQVAHRKATSSEFLEEARYFIFGLLPFFAALAIWGKKKMSEPFFLSLLATLSIAVPSLRSAWRHGYYYLPVLGLSWICLRLALNKAQDSRRGWIVLPLLAFLFNPTFFGPNELYNRWQKISLGYTPNPTELYIANLSESTSQEWIDVNLRAPLPASLFKSGRIHFFDSLSESPSSIKSKTQNPDDQITVACWDSKESSSKEFQSPAALSWGKLTHSECPHTQFLSEEWVKPFLFAQRAHYFSFLRSDQLPTHEIELPSPTILYPRLFEKSDLGVERWDGPYFFEKDFEIQYGGHWEQPILEIQVKAVSSCKHDGNLKLEWSSDGQLVRSQISVNIQGQLEDRYKFLKKLSPKIRTWAENWLNRNFDLEPLVVRIQQLKPARKGQIKISAEFQENRCVVALGNIQIL